MGWVITARCRNNISGRNQTGGTGLAGHSAPRHMKLERHYLHPHSTQELGDHYKVSRQQLRTEWD